MGIFKKKKEKVRTFNEGKEQAPDQVPELEIPVPLPQDQNFKPGQEVELDESGQYRVVSDCFICHDHLYYQDARGVWRECPRCSNPPGPDAPTDEKEPDDDRVLPPGRCWRYCSACGQDNQVLSTKTEFLCEHCATINNFKKPKGGK